MPHTGDPPRVEATHQRLLKDRFVVRPLTAMSVRFRFALRVGRGPIGGGTSAGNPWADTLERVVDTVVGAALALTAAGYLFNGKRPLNCAKSVALRRSSRTRSQVDRTMEDPTHIHQSASRSYIGAIRQKSSADLRCGRNGSFFCQRSGQDNKKDSMTERATAMTATVR